MSTIIKRGGRPVEHDHEAWRRLYDAGCSDSEIARQHGACHTTVIHWRRKHGLTPNRDCRPLTGAQDKARRVLHAEGLTDAEIAEEIGVTSASIRKWRQHRGLAINRAERTSMTRRAIEQRRGVGP